MCSRPSNSAARQKLHSPLPGAQTGSCSESAVEPRLGRLWVLFGNRTELIEMNQCRARHQQQTPRGVNPGLRRRFGRIGRSSDQWTKCSQGHPTLVPALPAGRPAKRPRFSLVKCLRFLPLERCRFSSGECLPVLAWARPLRGRRVVSFCFRSVPPWAFESLEAIPTLPVDLHGTTARTLFDRCSSSDRGACDQRQGARNDSHARKCGERSQSHEVQHQSFSLGAEVVGVLLFRGARSHLRLGAA